MNILHIISNLNQGGAERVLYNLSNNDKNNIHTIISLNDVGYYGKKLIKNDIKVYNFNLKNNTLKLFKLLKLFLLIKRIKPDVVQTWMYHADFIGGIFAKCLGIKNILWGVRNSYLDIAKIKITTRLIIYINSKLSKYIPTKIISCSKVAILDHINIGYDHSKFIFIPNGFKRNLNNINNIKKVLYKKYDINDTFLTFSHFARWDLQKDHQTLLKSFFLFNKKYFNKWILFLAGNEINYNNVYLNNLIKQYNLDKNIILLDRINNIYDFFSIININVLSSSYGEGFPNIIAEGMLSGVPCVSTDVGDSKFIIKESGWVSKPNNPKDLSDSILLAANEFKTQNFSKRIQLSKDIINNSFSLDSMINNFNNLYNE